MKITNRIGLALSILLSLSACDNTSSKTDQFSTEKYLQLGVEKVNKTIEDIDVSDGFPRFVDHDKTKWEMVRVNNWCSGFWPGILWYAYEASGDNKIKEQAEIFTLPLKEIAFSKAEDHDIGFQVYCSYGNGYRLTKNPEYKKVLLAAADTLATLFNPVVGSIHSWPSKPQYPHNTIIDNMMNLELLFWAAKNGGSSELYDMAESHAEVTMNNIVRADGSAYHLASFDDKTGDFIRGVAHQGYADESMWARGQAWGIYGFAMSYRETGRQDFLETAIKLTDHFLFRLPEDGIPYWDFDDPKIPNTPKDASAAAIAACGMLELSKLVKPEAHKKKYFNEALKLITLLSTDNYLTADNNDAILTHSVGHMPKGTEIDLRIIYADYYYMEALLRLKRMTSVQSN